MAVNATEIKALVTELYDVSSAIMAGNTVWMRDPVDGWVITRMVYPSKPRTDYHIGEQAPE